MVIIRLFTGTRHNYCLKLFLRQFHMRPPKILSIRLIVFRPFLYVDRRLTELTILVIIASMSTCLVDIGSFILLFIKGCLNYHATRVNNPGVLYRPHRFVCIPIGDSNQSAHDDTEFAHAR
jgi:hypothetical protein